MYGCNNKNNPGECRIFPFILGKMNKYFCYDYSRFGVQKSKEATARVALYKELKNVHSLTVHISRYHREGSEAPSEVACPVCQRMYRWVGAA